MKDNVFTTLREIRIPKTIKRVFNFTAGLFLTICCFFGSYFAFQNGWMDLHKVDKFEGVITEKGITPYKTSISGRYRTAFRKKAFYLKLEGLDQTLAVYNLQQNYDLLDNSLNIGDKVKVFYKYSNLKDRPNLETFQIEKNHRKILHRQDFQGRERIGFYIMFLSGFALLFLTIYQDKKLK